MSTIPKTMSLKRKNIASNCLIMALAWSGFAAIAEAADPQEPAAKKPAAEEAMSVIPGGWHECETLLIGTLDKIEHSDIIQPSEPPVRFATLVISVEKVLRGGHGDLKTLRLTDRGRRVEPINFPAGKRYMFGAKGDLLLKIEELIPAGPEKPLEIIPDSPDAVARKLVEAPPLPLLDESRGKPVLIRVTNAPWFKSLGGSDPAACDFATHDLVVVQGTLQDAHANVRFTSDAMKVNFEVTPGKWGANMTYDNDENFYRQAFVVKKDAVLTPTPLTEEQVDSNRLFRAVAMGNSDRLKCFIRAGINLEASGPENGRRALHWASERKNIGIVCMLLDAGAKADSADSKGWQPLHCIAATSYGEDRHQAELIIKSLLSKGAKVDAADADGCQALHRAVARGYAETVKLLIQAGASPDAKTSDGKTPLDLAHEGGYYLRHMLTLLKAGAEADADRNGMTLLHHASKIAGRYEVPHILELLKSGSFKVDAPDHAGNQPLHYAMAVPNVSPGYDYYGQLLCCKELIAAGASLNAKNKAGQTPSALIAHQELRDHLANARQQELSLLTKAAAAGDPNGIKEAVAKHGKWLLNLTDDQGSTALHQTISKGQTEVVKALLAEGASPNIANADAMSPLHLAVIAGQSEIVKLLLAAGASPAAQNNNSKTPLDLATEAKSDALIPLLQSKQP